MSRYKTLNDEDAEKALSKIAGLEPLIVDGKLKAVIAGNLRIYPSKDVLLVSEQES